MFLLILCMIFVIKVSNQNITKNDVVCVQQS